MFCLCSLWSTSEVSGPLHTQQAVIVGFGVPSNKAVFFSGREVSAGPGVSGPEFGHGHLLGL